MPLRRITALAVLVVVLMVSAACGGDSEDSSASSSSASSRPQSTASSQSTPSATSTSEASQAQSCTGGSIPTDATGVSHNVGDIDGNGVDDAVNAFRSGGSAHVFVQLDTYGPITTPIDDADLSDEVAPEVLGLGHVGGDHAVAFVHIGSGASTTLVALYTVVGCDLVRLTLPGHDSFAIGGTITHLDGLQCTHDGLQVKSATTDDGANYTTSVQDARIENGALVAVGEPTIGTMKSGDPGLDALGTLVCEGVDSP